MPARKHREGAALEDWLSRKAQQSQKMEMARLRVQSLTRHILLKPIEAAAMLGVTRKTLREMEARGELPPRITFSAKVSAGVFPTWRLSLIGWMEDIPISRFNPMTEPTDAPVT